MLTRSSHSNHCDGCLNELIDNMFCACGMQNVALNHGLKVTKHQLAIRICIQAVFIIVNLVCVVRID